MLIGLITTSTIDLQIFWDVDIPQHAGIIHRGKNQFLPVRFDYRSSAVIAGKFHELITPSFGKSDGVPAPSVEFTRREAGATPQIIHHSLMTRGLNERHISQCHDPTRCTLRGIHTGR